MFWYLNTIFCLVLSATDGAASSVGVDIQDNAGAVRFGTAGDVSIYRAGANLLRTDNILFVAGNHARRGLNVL